VATSRIVEHVGRVLIDRYRLTRPLGTGASAHVYVAEDVTLRRRVAVKLLHPGLADDEAFLRRFQAEARVVAALRHPNIVRVYDWGDDHGSPFLVMELLEGGSLRSLLDRGQLLSPAQAARVGIEAARALDYAHRRGLVHRDIKSANLLFDEDGQVSVADFGLARALAEATWTEPVGAMLGTARYAAPEQIGGGPLDGKADVYALALVLVEAVTGKVPFAADTTIGTLMARVDRDLPVPDELGPLTAAIAAAGTAQPAQRVDAAAFAAALTSAARHLPAPAALTLAAVEVDATRIDEDPDLTQLPFGSKLFDAERVERADRPPVSGERTTAAVAPPPRHRNRRGVPHLVVGNDG
jgi:serine/threonine-protein kinase